MYISDAGVHAQPASARREKHTAVIGIHLTSCVHGHDAYTISHLLRMSQIDVTDCVTSDVSIEIACPARREHPGKNRTCSPLGPDLTNALHRLGSATLEADTQGHMLHVLHAYVDKVLIQHLECVTFPQIPQILGDAC